jgi:hypothetical protein
MKESQKESLSILVRSDAWKIVTQMLNDKIAREQRIIMEAENFDTVLEARAKIKAYQELIRLEYYK